MPTSKAVSAKVPSPVGVRVQDLALVGQLVEERLVALAPELLAEAYARRDGEPEVRQAVTSVAQAWKQFDRQVGRMVKSSKSPRAGRKKGGGRRVWVGEAWSALTSSLVDLAGALERGRYWSDEPTLPEVDRALAKAFGPVPAPEDTGVVDWKGARKDAKAAVKAVGRG